MLRRPQRQRDQSGRRFEELVEHWRAGRPGWLHTSEVVKNKHKKTRRVFQAAPEVLQCFHGNKLGLGGKRFFFILFLLLLTLLK